MFKSKPLAVAVAVTFATPLSLIAVSAGAAVLEETVVTAQKREQSIQDVGIAITAYTGDQLDQLGFTNAQQVTAMAPGVQTIQPNGEANYSVAVRGVVANDFSTNVESPVALYIDEVYISQMSGAGFMLYDTER
ncbi:MAG: Plug domain-containing protein, partial [Gammaproteobacteria bacterium]|nr:Plug domain-containing protein [Gammaproteobacteria bacterium]